MRASTTSSRSLAAEQGAPLIDGFDRLFWRRLWTIGRPFWVSDQKWIPLGLLAVTLLLTGTIKGTKELLGDGQWRVSRSGSRPCHILRHDRESFAVVGTRGSNDVRGVLHRPGTVIAPSTRAGSKGRTTMASGKSDELKGRVKEAAGALTGDDELKREGQVDQAAGKIKQAVEKVVDKVKDAIG
jgi:uncharacterized protein YjbJ (UPF0337 family)